MDLKEKNIIHVSHIDSDGYSAQYMTNFLFSNIDYFNINYNDSLISTLYSSKYILKKPILILSDISMMNHEMISFLREIGGLFEHIFYIDHHQDEITINDDKLTIIHNKEKSSTEITYDYFIKDEPSLSNYNKDKLYVLSKLITVYDLNKIEHEDFCESTVINDACMAEWCNPFDYKNKYNIGYRFIEIDCALESVIKKESFLELTQKIDKKRLDYIKKAFIRDDKIEDIYDGLSLVNSSYYTSINHMLFIEYIKSDETFLKASNSVKQKYLNNILSNVNINSKHRRREFLELYKNEFQNNMNFLRVLQKLNMSEIKPEEGVVVLNKEKQMLFHSIAPLILENKDISVLCNILDENRISIRTSEGIRANVLAKEIFNGGGHKQEAGGAYSGDILEIKNNIKKYLHNNNRK